MLQAWKLVSFLLQITRSVPWARFRTLAAIATGLLCGVVYPGLIALITASLNRPFDRALFLGFAGLCILGPTTRLLSQTLFDSVGTRAIFELRLELARKILATPLRNLEEIGAHRLLASLSDDVTAITTALTQLPMLSMQIAVVVTAFAYMLWLSPSLFLLVLGGCALIAASFRLPVFRTRRYFERLRRETDAMFAHFRDLIYGSKELKLHRLRRESFVTADLIPTGESMRRSELIGNSVYTAANTWGNLLFFSVLGAVLFGFAGPEPDLQVLTGYTLALLYLKVPLEVVVLSLPVLSRAATASASLERLGAHLASPGGGAADPAKGAEKELAWRTLELVDVRHSYRVEGEEDAFTLGPIRLTLTPGEIVFLIGGNGSGKTTLAKILTGLYAPEQGEIRVDGIPVTDANRDDYRQMFAAVFADFFLFQRLAGGEGEDAGSMAAEYLLRLQLDRKVRVENGAFSTLDLSQGQRKRLALIAAALEDRPIYLFDEWAADQDPQFKEVFYREILPGLKARGKTVVAITHDDRYFAVADRCIKLSDGRVEWERLRGEGSGSEAAPRHSYFNETMGSTREARRAGT
jgi:putative ATP-binding cassette transporter